MDIMDWVAKVHALPADQRKGFVGSSPGAVASELGISRQAVHKAIERDRMDAYYLTRKNALTAVLIPEYEVTNYRQNFLRKTG